MIDTAHVVDPTVAAAPLNPGSTAVVDFIAELLDRLQPARFLRWLTFVILSLGILWILINYETLGEYFEARDRLTAYNENNARLQQRQAELESELKALESGGFPAEKAIRERLFMVKPGEKIIFIEEPEK